MFQGVTKAWVTTFVILVLTLAILLTMATPDFIEWPLPVKILIAVIYAVVVIIAYCLLRVADATNLDSDNKPR